MQFNVENACIIGCGNIALNKIFKSQLDCKTMAYKILWSTFDVIWDLPKVTFKVKFHCLKIQVWQPWITKKCGNPGIQKRNGFVFSLILLLRRFLRPRELWRGRPLSRADAVRFHVCTSRGSRDRRDPPSSRSSSCWLFWPFSRPFLSSWRPFEGPW